MALVKKYKCMNVGNCKDAQKTVFEIPVGEKLECPTCHKEMLVEVKGGNNMRMLAIIAAVVVALSVGGFFALRSGGTTEGSKTPIDSLEKPHPKPNPDPDENGVDTTGNGGGEHQSGTDSQGGEPSTPLPPIPEGNNTHNLGYGIYEGPMANGKPNGIGGKVQITKSYTIDLKDGKGGSVTVECNDEIVDTKFTNGRLIQGEIHHKDGTRKWISIGG